jgi:hypothetical protein
MSLYEITCSGCDDHTTVEMELTPDEFVLISKLCEKVTDTSTYGCQPTMRVEQAINEKLQREGKL